ncbi:response regulator transcription factor [Pontibacter sp. MBLB2868]|uniref:response regulator transcription factor n=1 Tax=Pontibacter sp. MBLB2868 TaxID=3451555 RepID=UPI003F7537CD
MIRKLRPLSNTECKVIALLAEGYNYQQIGKKFKWSEQTVEVTLHQMKQKLELEHSYELISWAYRHGILI